MLRRGLSASVCSGISAIPLIVQELTADQDWLRQESISALTRIGLPFLDYLEDLFCGNPGSLGGNSEVLGSYTDERSAEIAYLACRSR